MSILSRGIAAALLASATLVASAPVASADEAGVKVGVLSCRVEGGWGFVFGSSKDLYCSYSPTKGHVDRYTGSIDKYGVDVGYTEGSVMVWAVVAPTSNVASALRNCRTHQGPTLYCRHDAGIKRQIADNRPGSPAGAGRQTVTARGAVQS